MTTRISYNSGRCLVCLSKSPWHSGASVSAAPLTISSAKSISTTSDTTTDSKVNVRTFLPKSKDSSFSIGYNLTISTLSCLSIITQNQPTKDQCHGCPYRSHTTSNLSSLLLSSYSHLGFNHAHLAEITRLTEEQHYHVACTRTYEITHSKDGVKKGDGIGGGESVTHPNQYTTKSRDFEKTKVKDEADMSVQMEM